MKFNRLIALFAALLFVVSAGIAIPLAVSRARSDFSSSDLGQSFQNGDATGNSNEEPSPSLDGGNGSPAGDGDNLTGAKDGRVSFLAAGDVVLHESVFLDASLNAGGTGASGSVTAASEFDFEPMYQYVKTAISAADLSMVNQETLVAASADGVPQGYPRFSGPSAAGDILSEVGFDVVNIGNNHMLDVASAGLRRSIEFWRSKTDIRMIGAYLNRAECDNVLLIDKNGVKIAILPYLGQTPGTNGISHDDSLYIPYLNENLVRTQVTAARGVADCVIVTVHWGNEGTYLPNQEQKKYANLFASLGVDAVIGTHPHVLQPMEWIERTEYSAGGKMLLCYSLGDFLSHTQLAGGKNRLGNLLGGYVTFDIVKDENGSHLENVLFVPTVSHYNETTPLDTGFCIYPLSAYTDALVQNFGDPNAGFRSVNQLHEIVNKNIPEEFLSLNGES